MVPVGDERSDPFVPALKKLLERLHLRVNLDLRMWSLGVRGSDNVS